METTYSTEQEAFRDSLRRYLTEKCDQDFARRQAQQVIPHTPEVWDALVAMGITSVLVPEAQGGLGMTMVDMGVVMEELGRRVNPAPVLSSAVAATSAAVILQQTDMLSKLASGTCIATLAFEEDSVGFLNWQQPQLQARNQVLNGKKVRVLDGMAADTFFVTANDGVYLVNANAKGLLRETQTTIDSSRRIASITFSNVQAKKIAELSSLAPVLDRLIVALSADAIGAAEMALFLSLQYAKERIQFAVPIGSFQAVQHMLAEMFQQVEMAKAGLHYALWCLDQGALDAADAREAHRAAVMIKAFVCDKFPKLGADAVQIFGGAGFTWEYDIHLYYKRLLSAELLFGNSEVWLEELARIAID
jgi:alkylation response protein AidB-like acyl-CoA dehydrogenase